MKLIKRLEQAENIKDLGDGFGDFIDINQGVVCACALGKVFALEFPKEFSEMSKLLRNLEATDFAEYDRVKVILNENIGTKLAVTFPELSLPVTYDTNEWDNEKEKGTVLTWVAGLNDLFLFSPKLIAMSVRQRFPDQT